MEEVQGTEQELVEVELSEEISPEEDAELTREKRVEEAEQAEQSSDEEGEVL